jgi:hypothetical protein
MIAKSRGLLLTALIGLAVCAWALPARALDFNGIKVTPSISYTGEYDDNVFRSQFNKRSDYSNTYSPGVTVEANPGKHELKALYRADFIRYLSHTTNDSDRHTASLLANFNFNRLAARFSGEFRRTDDFPTTELTTRIPRNEYTTTGGFDYDVFQVWGVGFDVARANVHYLRSDLDILSRNSYTYATNVYYRVTTKTRMFAEYNFVREIFEFDKSRDNNRHRGLVGVRGELTERLHMTGKLGYEHLDFHADTRSGQDNFVTSINADYKPLERLGIGLSLKRSVESSTFTGNPQFENFMTNLFITYALTPKVTLTPHGFFGVDLYRESATNIDLLEKRVDYNYGGGLGIRYELQKWIRLDGNYDFSRRDSNFNSNDYDDNRVSFTLTLSM